MKKILFFSFLSLGLISCDALKTGTAKSMDVIGPGVIQMPVVADLDVRSTKVSHTITYTTTNKPASSNAKSDVIRELLKRENADVLIEPTFESVKSGSRTELTVYGFPATYVNFRPIQQEDVELLEVAPQLLQKAESEESIFKLKKS